MATATQPTVTFPDEQTAYNNLFNGVHQRTFFAKLASLGYTPQNEQQASHLLDLAGKLRLVHQEEVVKQAEESYDPFAAANMALDGVLEQRGYGSVKNAAANEEVLSIKAASAEWAEDPDLYNSVLVLKAREAQDFINQHQSQLTA